MLFLSRSLRVKGKVKVKVKAKVKVTVRVGTHFHKPTHSASTHNGCTQTTSLVGLGRIMSRRRAELTANGGGRYLSRERTL